MKKFKPSIVEFSKHNIIISKIYLFDYKTEDKYYQLIIIITYNKYIFFPNNVI